MSWRSLIISKPSKLSLKNHQLLIQQEQKISVPIEDIVFILIEAKEVVITAPLLSALAENGTTLLSVDNNFLPCGQWLPFAQYHRQLKIIKLQIQAGLPLKKQLQQHIIKHKILNQSTVLKLCGDHANAKKLVSLANQVKSGDKDNIEAQSAKFYFSSLFGKDFYRRRENIINSYLNYGYIILRSAIARNLAVHGYITALGFFHKNELNAFNLADDLIEAYRPLVDLYTFNKLSSCGLDNDFKVNDKHELVALLHNKIDIHQKTYTTLAAIEKSVMSLQSALSNKKADLLLLPNIIGLGEETYE